MLTKHRVAKRTEWEILRDYPISGRLAGWYFRLREVSNNAREVEGTDRWGRKVRRSGGDLEILLSTCVWDARQIDSGVQSDDGRGNN